MDVDVEIDPVAATRGALTNSQSRIRVFALATAVAWPAMLGSTIALWQTEAYLMPCAGRQVCPGAGVICVPTAYGLPCASNGSGPSFQPVHSDGEQLAVEISISARLFLATQSAAGKP